MDLDDFTGESCGQGKNPLITTAKDIVNGGGPSSRPSTTRPSTTTPPDQTLTAKSYCLNSKEKQIYANISTACKSYYECLTTPAGKQITVTRKCPSNLLYSEDEKKCVKEKHVKCSTKFAIPVASSSSDCPWGVDYATEGGSMCKVFTNCSKKQRFGCPPDARFDKNINQCVPEGEVQCWW
ncbi:unnamed protein product [Didymodactylos carnosus]|uniref:Chitin-binding type-2 domain-containing protein n=1 Tax=Didymodactylos carnosus TaxID=1234261 RepID=A0A8S2EZE1_9BILA|nr:unnamed protein product [Didymodactylos carnosus]CAF4084917.1 unnamed protein product [Didymodactylos carnosus]